MALNIADLFEHAVDVVPERTALIVGERRVTYAELESEANRLAHYLASEGVGAGDHVGILSKNSVEHVVALLAAYKLRAIAININYRYVEGELDYIVDNADLVVLLHERVYADLVAKVFPKHDQLRRVVVIDDGTEEASAREAVASYGGVAWADAVADRPTGRDFDERSNDDLYVVYTGGTTGYPKGVMWRHEDVWRTLGGGIDFYSGERLEEHSQSRKATEGQPMMTFPLSPIMHGGAQWGMLMHLFAGHATILAPTFDPAEIWSTIEREKVQLIFMTGDAMARPLIEEFERGEYDASSLFAVSSSAAIFSRPVKERWMAAFPNTIFTDSVGSSETGFQGMGMVDKESLKAEGAVTTLGPEVVVLDEQNRILDPAANVGVVGRLARGGSVPLGYYKDPEKSAATFLEIDGARYSVPGDFVRIEDGNRITLLGRGSNCINTGGEKVYPEEVEMALKTHPAVFDALVVATPDERFGQRVTAVVQTREGEETPSLTDLDAHLRSQLSGYKIPRSLVTVDQIPRHVTGKANYPKARDLALAGVSDGVPAGAGA
ncbi:acyl-CoA synthetase [Nocardioides sp. HDW12B]|uniref:acyl-CoA synthetase n=1 Tax=Nocardioides sp. HDW12B TaxID=2714939 RepID=UPI00140AD802|nr:acyl-CoA synthetase [Nocardioides sp. HDW12B]QIK66309.1 acyl-CoA synthetase [Nocardioides sp. HDW12B]